MTASIASIATAFVVSSLAPTAALAAPGQPATSTPSAGDSSEAVAKNVNERRPRGGDSVATDGLPWLTNAAQDIKGYRASAYEGDYYDKRFEQYRLCVVQRESGGNYDEATGAFVGAYQMGSYNSPSRVVGKLRTEMEADYGSAATKELNRLARQPLHQWNRFWQDAAFWTIFNGGAGWRQWSAEWGANWNCDHRANAEKGWPSKARYNYTPIEKPAASSESTRNTDKKSAKKDASQKSKKSQSTKSKKSLRGTRHGAVERRFGDSKHSVGSPQYSRWLARKYINAEYGWKSGQFKALKQMWFKESNWRFEVVNWQGPWYGLGQVNGPYIQAQGFSIRSYRASPYIQIKVGADYIKGRYGSPKKAWQFWEANGWY